MIVWSCICTHTSNSRPCQRHGKYNMMGCNTQGSRGSPICKQRWRNLHVSSALVGPNCVKTPRTGTLRSLFSVVSLSLSLVLLGWYCFSKNVGSARRQSLPRDPSSFPPGFSFSSSLSRIFSPHYPLSQSLSHRLLIVPLFFLAAFAILLHCPKLCEFSIKFQSSIFQFRTYVCLCLLIYWLKLSFLQIEQHLDSPDNNPDLPWEFSDANKEKVGENDPLISFISPIFVCESLEHGVEFNCPKFETFFFFGYFNCCINFFGAVDVEWVFAMGYKQLNK